MLQTSRLTCIVCIITNSHLALSKCLVDTKATHDVKAVLASQLSSQVTLSLMDRILKSCSTCHWHSIGKQETMTEQETHCNWPSLQLTLTASGSHWFLCCPMSSSMMFFQQINGRNQHQAFGDELFQQRARRRWLGRNVFRFAEFWIMFAESFRLNALIDSCLCHLFSATST